MGRFFTNLQVHVGQRAPSALRDAIVELLEQDARTAGLVSVESPTSATRVIAIGAPSPRPWIPVLDEATEDQDARVLDRLASVLSKTFDTHVVSVLVHDSDVLDLRLFDRGRCVDRFVNLPDYFARVSAKQRRAVSGDAKRWAPVLAPSATRDALQRAFAREHRTAEAALGAVARNLGLAEWHDLGVRDLVASGADGTGWMCFAPSPPVRTAEAPPRLEAGSSTGRVRLTVGEALHWTSIAVNRGGRVAGVEVTVGGSALDGGAVQVRRAHLAVPGPRGDMTRSTVDFEHSRGGAVRCPDVDVPPPSAVTAAPQVVIAFEGRAAQQGGGRLEARVAPLDGRAPAIHFAVDVLVEPGIRAPLKAPGEVVAAAALRALHTPATLVGMIALRAPRQAAAQACADGMRRWVQAITGGRRATFVTTTYGPRRPKNGRLKSPVVSEGEGWRRLREDLDTCGAVSMLTRIDLKTPRALDVLGPSHGAAFHVSLVDTLRDPSLLSPHAAFWFDVRHEAAPDVAHLKRELRQILDDLMMAGAGHQAFVATWDWRPSTAFHPTPYETACGVHGQCTALHTWVERYVHAVSDIVWLGPSLHMRVSDLDACARVATLTRLGSAVRLECGDPTAITGLELALEPVLADADAWKAAVARWSELIDPDKLARFAGSDPS